MAPTSHASTASDQDQPTLADIGAEIRQLAATMVTKNSLQTLATTLSASITTAVTVLQNDLDTQKGRIQTLEHQAQTAHQQATAPDTAVARQGNMLLALRRQVEDLDNRSRRSNIRVRGMPKSEDGENAEELLTGLFLFIIGADASAKMRFDRAHRALRPRLREGDPQDIICCLHSYSLKEKIMRATRTRDAWRYRGAETGTPTHHYLRLDTQPDRPQCTITRAAWTPPQETTGDPPAPDPQPTDRPGRVDTRRGPGRCLPKATPRADSAHTHITASATTPTQSSHTGPNKVHAHTNHTGAPIRDWNSSPYGSGGSTSPVISVPSPVVRDCLRRPARSGHNETTTTLTPPRQGSAAQVTSSPPRPGRKG
ncbi:Hypothetical predicted protein [Pelobates cultripes]|uniref:Uncharacterized protein n=1 Tax=Pelobates cultripes TaxID=61616 RepID=A0AAD1W1N5_PELCU|nr:Hypothetical predicted protein [Pelobates cultripes]